MGKAKSVLDGRKNFKRFTMSEKGGVENGKDCVEVGFLGVCVIALKSGEVEGDQLFELKSLSNLLKYLEKGESHKNIDIELQTGEYGK